MNDMSLQPAPARLVPVLIGALAMTAMGNIPMLQLVNCLCCAGLMGGAVLGVWFYKKNVGPESVFRVSDGVVIGTLSGLIASVISSIILAIQIGIFSPDFAGTLQVRFDEVFSQMEAQGNDPAQLEQARRLLEQLAATPAAVFAILVGVVFLMYTGFGALGGVIGGNLFKTRPSQIPPPSNPL